MIHKRLPCWVWPPINPHISTWQIESELSHPKSIIHRILKFHNFHPYHVTLTQELMQDFQQKLVFCRWARTMLRHDPTFFRYVLF
ncbi:hypothetical protein P5V15_007180 [Pogonomyrmex californicus]